MMDFIPVFPLFQKLHLIRASTLVVLIILFSLTPFSFLFPFLVSSNRLSLPDLKLSPNSVSLDVIATYFADFPLNYTNFGESGRRIQILQNWVENASGDIAVWTAIEIFALSLFPFLRHPVEKQPLLSLLRRHVPGSRGIVVPVGTSSFRFACHLVGSIRNVLNSQIPIEIAYAGESDLPLAYRQFLSSLAPEIYLLDVTSYFDDDIVGLSIGTWAIKPFAILASRFEQVILMDSDSILLQEPEKILDSHNGFKKTGLLLFHDRLLWKNAYPERHAWWQEQMKHTSPSLNFRSSRVHNENYAEEGESGLVVVDKARISTLMGVLHVAWQNTKDVRTQVTYLMGYGDKESWWLAFELVCSFHIAHTDENDALLWFNGGLLKSKMGNNAEYWFPEVWMLDGEWEKSQDKSTWSCMKNGTLFPLDERTVRVLQESVNEARRLDPATIDYNGQALDAVDVLLVARSIRALDFFVN
ncbi:hypothetical protein D8B26_005246 [Coccidioides posadasii str. Silveira]|uniref:uncharacterized protein n=1 Tax=Coccidioides posadasii (strain RMSCC 757 / Silveira) TaxID=443226 RepID=UPI001BEF5008|nr:hypothetical protein D8B26_005246 [Coccidioides posadasii str. Silveira]